MVRAVRGRKGKAEAEADVAIVGGTYGMIRSASSGSLFCGVFGDGTQDIVLT